jgi:hypothetical protein
LIDQPIESELKKIYDAGQYDPYKTKRTDVRRHAENELLIFNISVEQAIKDSIEGKNITIDRVQELIFKNTNSINLLFIVPL